MANEVAKTQTTSLMATFAQKMGMEPAKCYQMLVDTAFKAEPPLNPSEVAAAVAVCHRYDLDPLMKEIHVTRSRGRLLTMVGIDGWLRIAKRTGKFNGIEFEEARDQEGKLFSVTAKVWRKDEDHPTVITAYMSEHDKGSDPWKQYPSRMLRHKAAKEALRYAFNISGLDHEEPDEIQVIEPQKTIVPKAITVQVSPMDVAPVVEPVVERQPGEEG